MTPRLHAAVAWGMDGYSVRNGQFRYAADLLAALARRPADVRLTVFGTRPQPPAEVAGLFAPGTGWRWVHQPPPAVPRGAGLVRQWRAVRAAVGHWPAVLHVIDAAVPAVAPCPVVQTVYDLMYELFPADYAGALASRPYRCWRWLSRHRVARHLAISRSTAADLHRLWKVPAGRIDVVPLGTAFPPPGPDAATDAARRLPAGRPVLLSPYNLEPRKNLAALLDALPAVRSRFPAAVLALFGRAAWTADREAAFDARVDRLGLRPAVVRLGPVDDRTLAALYRAADLFVFPSLYEGFGLPVLEALACGGCVLARNTSAMPEVAGDAAVLTETADPAALAAAAVRVLADPAVQARLRAAGPPQAAGFTAARMAAGTLACYHRAAGR